MADIPPATAPGGTATYIDVIITGFALVFDNIFSAPSLAGLWSIW